MASKIKNVGGILGIAGLIVWAAGIFLNIPSFLGTENRLNIFIDYVTNLDFQSYILPIAFILFAVFSIIRQNLYALISGVVALAMSGWIIYNGKDNIESIIVAVIAALCVAAAVMKKN